MSKVPQISIVTTSGYTGQQNRTGSLCNAYAPLKNLEDSTKTLTDFTTDSLNFDLQHPVDIILQDSYDGAVNMLINDGKNIPRLINSRFSVVDNNEFKIPDHTGHKDTNIYTEESFNIDTALKAIAQKIPKIKYNGLTQFAGSLPCGAYTFYFKVADADGNESEVLAESGIVQVYIGGNSYPDINVRMGTEDENSGKAVNFTLTNLDTGFDYVHVLYARSSSSNDQASIDTYNKILFDYPISKGECNITITGNEQIVGISAEELYTDYADIENVKTQSVVNNVLFFGNVKKQEHDWDALRIASWKIGYSYENTDNVGSIKKDYQFSNSDTDEEKGCYYNTFNTYYRVGYWADEIYRFGIVYIFEDNSLSPVFNIQGVDFNQLNSSVFTGNNLFQTTSGGSGITYHNWESSPEDYYFDKNIRKNSKGVVKFPDSAGFFKKSDVGLIIPNPIYIKFDFTYINKEIPSEENTPEDFFKKHKIKGCFFVRQKRIPTILAQGLAIGLTKKDNGALPIIKPNSYRYKIQSFLNESQLLTTEGNDFELNGETVSINALLVPDAEVNEATFNQLFTSNKYALIKVGQYYFKENGRQSYVNELINRNTKSYIKRKLTNVPEDTKILTDGEMYFSTIAGNPNEPYKTSDVINVWNKTKPQELTRSKSVVRGNWGCFVGIGDIERESDALLSYGGVYNIKTENYADDFESAVNLDFQLRMEREDSYNAICDRTELEFDNDGNIINDFSCYRGDCFQSLFTHRVFRNFADPELPTNDKIINPACWAQNYAVRCTAIDNIEAKYNVYPEVEGWMIDKDQDLYANEIVTAFEVKEIDEKGNDKNEWKWSAKNQYWYIGDEEHPNRTETQLGGFQFLTNYIEEGKIKIVKPSEQEQSGVGGILKNIFKSSKWAIRGLASINRADVNAVGLGQWITFPICSSKNLALRDIDYSNATEQATFNKKRSFYPLQKMDIHNPLRDSNIINQAAGISIPQKKYYIIPDVPFIKQEYFTRVLNSLRDSAESITNEFKVMLEGAYRDYTKIYGPITKLVPLGSKMLVVFHHGLGILALNDQMSQAASALEYLPVELNMTLSPDYGSMWKDSIIETPKGIYGIDTVAKVIWKIVLSESPQLSLISNFKVEKFLIDNIDLSEFTYTPFVGRINVKSHYNAFKQDVIFTYYNDILYKFDSSEYNNKNISEYDITSDGYLIDKDSKEIIVVDGIQIKGEKVKAEYNEDIGKLISYTDKLNEDPSMFKWATGKSWSLCFNEVLEKFVTFYDWIPVESENIDNIWFSFDREATNKLSDLGYQNSLKKCITPDKDYGGRDDNYGQYAIDPTFNSTISVTYFDNSNKITFQNITYNYQSGKKLVLGCYVKNGDTYTFNINGIKIKDVETENSEGWTFVVLEISDASKTNIQVSVQLSGTSSINSNDLAISDIIYDIYDYEESTILLDAHKPTLEELPNYYTVRTLTDSLPLWKHGFAGLYDNADELKPTFWYGQQHEFNFEFVARKDAMHKIYNNLQIISNKTEPHKFEFEVVGEAYDWHKYKPVLKWIADQVSVATDHPNYQKELDTWFIYVLSNDYRQIKADYPSFPKIFGMKSTDRFVKLPYLKVTDACVPTMDPEIIGEKKGTKDEPNIYLTPEQQGKGDAHSDNSVTCCLVYDKQLNEFRVHTEQLGNDVWKYGRLRGNMQYLEDLWRIEIRPISFKWTYLQGITPQSISKSQNCMIQTDSKTGYIRRIYGDDYTKLAQFTINVPTDHVANVIPHFVSGVSTATIVQIGNGIRVNTQIQNSESFDIGGKQYFSNRNFSEITVIFNPNDIQYLNFWSNIEGGVPLNEYLVYSKIQETRHRDKYIKIKVRYTGKDLAVIQAISTLFNYSYA